MKKICFVTTVSLTMDAFILKFAEYLKNTGDYDISLACKTDPEFEKRVPEGIHFYPIPIERGASLSIFKATSVLEKLFLEQKFDMVQYSTPNASYCAAIAAEKAGIPVRLYSQCGLVYIGFTGIKRSIFKKIEKITCEKSTVVEPVSQSNLDYSVEEGLYLASKAHVVGKGSSSGVDLEKFDISMKDAYRKEFRNKLGISEHDLVYGFIGRLDRDKGINELLSAYQQVMNEHTHLLMVGPEDKMDKLDQQLYQWSLNEPSVIYTGFSSDTPQYLSCMDIFILPSYREGFGSVVIEAEAMGVPVIVTDIPGPREAMEDQKTGISVKKEDAAELADAMKLLANDKHTRECYGKSGNQYVREWFEQKKLFQMMREDRDSLLV